MKTTSLRIRKICKRLRGDDGMSVEERTIVVDRALTELMGATKSWEAEKKKNGQELKIGVS